MLGWWLAYVCVSLSLGALLGALGYRHRVWSRAHLKRGRPHVMSSILH
jgi:hypothetical protein